MVILGHLVNNRKDRKDRAEGEKITQATLTYTTRNLIDIDRPEDSNEETDRTKKTRCEERIRDRTASNLEESSVKCIEMRELRDEVGPREDHTAKEKERLRNKEPTEGAGHFLERNYPLNIPSNSLTQGIVCAHDE